ncbi:hypothetical protein MIB92_19425 [Aestuariirhabdus sp. Z084]|uniref:hypothetical protein n=1 Tax=Aestuariirhabdus haliotis TaxID=2918751 RepID=UPI00201B3EFD|nr:hypothetical protein [Aestuariirhabdus haliotis]MCL6417829.1 hypothetical protein [Aestuariirhabdus haliotis]MCL6421745.1 hypothetical protein [Aestuariirhabdus haliotis]
MANPKFSFEIGKRVLSLECSPFAKEMLTLDGRVVSETRSLKSNNKHHAEIEGRTYIVELQVNNILTGSLTCNLYESDKLVSCKTTQAELGEKNKTISIILLLVFCLLIGVAAPKMARWVWLSPLLFVLGVVVAMSMRERIYKIHNKRL